jgi:glutamate/aspartate transport system substrate-binding protein
LHHSGAPVAISNLDVLLLRASAFNWRFHMKLVPKTAFVLVAALFALTTQAQELTGTLKKIKDSGEITIGNRESSIPFSYLDDKQQPIGYSMDLCNKVVDAIKTTLKMPNLKVKYNPVTSQNRIPLVQNGTVDLECGSTTNSVDRQKQVSFGNTTFVTGIKMLVKANSGIKDIGDLNGKAVATTTGTTSDALIKASEKGKNIDVKNIYGKDHADSFLMVDSGRAAAFVMDDVLLAGLIANAKNPKDFMIVGESLRTEPYGIMIRKDDPQFKTLVDNTLTGLMKSGEINKIYDKWFMNPVPPRGININLPMSKELKDALANPNDKGVS